MTTWNGCVCSIGWTTPQTHMVAPIHYLSNNTQGFRYSVDRKRKQIFKGWCPSDFQRRYLDMCHTYMALSPLWIDWSLHMGLPYLTKENLWDFTKPPQNLAAFKSQGTHSLSWKEWPFCIVSPQYTSVSTKPEIQASPKFTATAWNDSRI